MSLELRSKLMVIVSVVLGIYAIIWGVAPYTSYNISARVLLDILDWPLDNMAAELDRNTKWLSAIGAGLLAAVAIFLGGIVAPALKRGDEAIIKVAFWAIMAWYIIDGLGSLAVGITSNVIFNTFYLVLMIGPLVGINYQAQREMVENM
ncbi:MAG: hypothetical protein COB30_012770 [Ectothiorhodospiraceae bacterium]|nr:hypothetical protein [Ectothiorhodospiraceae bacterium]